MAGPIKSVYYLKGSSSVLAGTGGNVVMMTDAYRQITLEKPATGNLLTWLEANAVRLPLEGTWVFNSTLSNPSFLSYTPYDVSIQASSNSLDITAMRFAINTATDAMQILYMLPGSSVSAYGSTEGIWTNQAYRTITFTEPVQYQGNEEFVKWFTANAKPGPVAGKTLNEYTWNEISQISTLDAAAAYGFKVGDAKEVTLNGSVGYGSAARTFNNQKYWVYIIGINHNEAKEGKGIAFQGFKTAQTGGIDIAVTGTNYNSSSSGMVMNSSKTSVGGWNGSWAHTTCMAQWKNCFPSDLQAVIRTTTLYTDNTGNGSKSASAVTANSNEVYYLAEYEVFGSNYYANTNESAQQAQYNYYKAGNSRVKYRSDNTSLAAYWWLRSPGRSNSISFCDVRPGGQVATSAAGASFGSAPCFKV